MSIEVPKFWKLSNSGTLKPHRNGTPPWNIDVEIETPLWHAVNGPKRIQDWPDTARGLAWRDDRREDIPCMYGDLFVVSPRVRELWVSLYPGTVDYYPFPIYSKSTGKLLESYFVPHVFVEVDCVNEAETRKKYDGMLTRAVLDPERVPSQIGIFRVKDKGSSIIIREEVRVAMKKSKITGWFAYGT